MYGEVNIEIMEMSKIATKIREMASDRFDVVIFGASGFTGQYVVEEFARTMEEESNVTWAVAGRSMRKLENVLAGASKQTGKNLEDIPIIIADVSSEESLNEMCKQAKIVANCVGPYALWGQQVVKACIENKTHHVDLSGEPGFLEKVQLLYNIKAKEEGVYILGAAGFDSIPAEMGTVYTKEQFEDIFGGDINAVEAYLKLDQGPSGIHGNYGTWYSAVNGFATATELRNTRKQLFTTPLPKPAHKITKRPTIFYSDDVKNYIMPFMGADRSIVNRSQRYNYENNKQRPIQFNAYMRVSGYLELARSLLMAIVFFVLSNFSFGVSLLLKYPYVTSIGMFGMSGPSRKQIEEASFSMTFLGTGYSTKVSDPDTPHEDVPDKRIVTKITGPEVGYATTPICMVQAIYTMLKEDDKIPAGGGVFTPGAMFAKTKLIKRLEDHGIKFSVVEK